ncbi:F0F1 ATP synthase subunit delta [Bifidobacterium aemilianum]|uniref:ATP synthase subunit delta n=1 Tax=Bifidobacterium aemilianum TaxID=2493120 RepID=A0A366KAH4_9BIFI|nr:F0F1 ATP synthase subunit delta [Bifidobacterium aemilianum]RBP97671.1 F0F1 ATP synthase subunit delta [Bifidobacterium aemilianum]
MRGEASRIADRTARDMLAPKLKGAGEHAWRVGQELFTVTNLLDHNAKLEHAFTDQSRSLDDKLSLLRGMFEGKADPTTIEILSDLIERKWSRPSDIANAVEDFAVDAMMYYADDSDSTLQVSLELAELHSALLKLPLLRAQLSDDSSDPAPRVALIDSVLKGNTLNRVTMRLAEHATCNLRNRRYLSTIQWLIGKFSRHMGQSMVTVTTATPLSGEQTDRLTQVYSKKMGHPVHINSVVDSSVIGGMRIQAGDEVTDNTVQAQLRELHRLVTSG